MEEILGHVGDEAVGLGGDEKGSSSRIHLASRAVCGEEEGGGRMAVETDGGRGF